MTCGVVFLLMVGSCASTAETVAQAGQESDVLGAIELGTGLESNGTTGIPNLNGASNETPAASAAIGAGAAPICDPGWVVDGMPMPPNDEAVSMSPQGILSSAPHAHWYCGAVYSGTPYDAQSVSCHLKVPNGWDVNTEFYYVLLSVFDDGWSYDQIGLANSNGTWRVASSWSSISANPPYYMDYHLNPDNYTFDLNVEYVFTMTLSAGYLNWYVSIYGGATVWHICDYIGSGSHHFVIAPTVIYPGDNVRHTDFTEYVETHLMEPTIQSPSFNWEFLQTKSDSTYVNGLVPWYKEYSGDVQVPQWMSTFVGANGYVNIWSGLHKITDTLDKSVYSIGSSVRWEDDSRWLAWTGTDSKHRLNVISTADMRNWGSKMTTSWSAYCGPSIIWTHESGGGSHLVMAWISTSNYVNTSRWDSTRGWTGNWTGNSANFPKSDRSPSLAFDTNNNVLYLAYKAMTTKKIVILRSYTDGADWSKIVTLNQTTRNSPSITWSGGQLFYLAFASDADPGNINVMQSTNCISWTNMKILPDKMDDSRSLSIGMTCTCDGLSISWYDHDTAKASFRRCPGGNLNWWGGRFSIPFGPFVGSASMCGLPKPDRYVAWTSTATGQLSLLEVCWPAQNPRNGTVDGFVDGFESSAAFAQDWGRVAGTSTPHTSSAQHHRGGYSYMIGPSTDLEAIQHNLSEQTYPGTIGRLEAWIYDPGPLIYAKVQLSACGVFPLQRFCALGIRSDSYPSDYVFRWDSATYYDTYVARTQGWHCFQIVIDGSNANGFIDGTSVFVITGGWLPSIDFFTVGDWWQDDHYASSVAWDDVSFSSSMTYV